MVTLFLCGDVMTGRGVDQILGHPGDPRLWEPNVTDARTYVELAEAVNGPIPRPVDDRWPWGDALQVLDDLSPDLRVINLETAITRSDDVEVGKEVCYRMNPDNIGCLTAARPDVCALANNHLLDFGRHGLEETLDSLERAGIAVAGAGRDADRAGQPAVFQVPDGPRVLVFSFGSPSSGVPASWEAASGRPGVAFLPTLSDATADLTVAHIQRFVRGGDLVVASVHWGTNWGYEVPLEQVHFAHRLVDGGVDVVHGHSSHHPRPIEIYQGKLILHGCGDLLDDYEGITGYEHYRDDLRLLYFASVEQETGRLRELRMVPMQTRKMRLHHANSSDRQWLVTILDRISQPFRARVQLGDDSLRLRM